MVEGNEFVGAMGDPAAEYLMAEVLQSENLRIVPIEIGIARTKSIKRMVVSVFN